MKNPPIEQLLTYLILISSLPSSLLALYLAWQAEYSHYLLAILTIVQGLVIAAAIFHARYQLSIRLRGAATVLEAALQGDFAIKAKQEHRESSLYDLVKSVNTLSKNLSMEQTQTAEKRALLTKIIDQIQVGVIMASKVGEIRSINHAAKRILGIEQETQIQSIDALPITIEDSRETRKILPLHQGNFCKRIFVQFERYREFGEENRLILLTEMDYLLRQEQFKSWEDLVRVISHEINNSLAPITSLSQSISAIVSESQLDNDSKDSLLECAAIINERAKSLNLFVAQYRNLSKINQPNLSLICINSVIDSVISLFKDKDIRVSSTESFHCKVDLQQIQQVLINLIKNAFESMANTMQENIAHKVCINLGKEEYQEKNYLRMDIEDNGKGIINTNNIFIPFYSTKPQGSGIGLALSRQIIELHNGSITLKNRHNANGCVATIRLPLH